MIDPDEDDFSELITCEWCGGQFLPDDMEGEHCRECAAEIFGND